MGINYETSQYPDEFNSVMWLAEVLQAIPTPLIGSIEINSLTEGTSVNVLSQWMIPLLSMTSVVKLYQSFC